MIEYLFYSSRVLPAVRLLKYKPTTLAPPMVKFEYIILLQTLFAYLLNFVDAFFGHHVQVGASTRGERHLSTGVQPWLVVTPGSPMDEIYPPAEVAQRNAASRKDGYWPFVARNEIPPQDFVYGEFPLDFFQDLIALAISMSPSCPGGVCKDAEFVDLGAGSGRLVIAASSSKNHWRKCRGVEILRSLHNLSLDKLTYATTIPGFLTAQQVEFENCDWGSADLDLSTADIVFSYTTALQSIDGSVLQALTEAISSKLKSGCVVVTTDYMLGDGFDLAASKIGKNEGVGGDCTGYVFVKQ